MGAAGVAALVLPACGSDEPDPFAGVDPTRCSLEVLASSLVAETEDGLVPLAGHLRAGVPADRLFGAALLVAARSVPPDADLHDVLFVPSAFFLSQRLRGPAERLPLARVWDRHGGSRATALRPLAPDRVSVAEGSAESLEAAFEAWDASAAERAMVRRYFDHGPAGVLDLLVRYGSRNHDWVGHTAIWTSLALRALESLGWECAPWLLRSVAGAITGNRPRSVTDDFEINRGRVAELPPGWRRGKDRPEAVPDLVDAMQLAEPQACVDVVIEATRAGASQRTIWTALAVAAVEHSVRWPSPSFGVHELDAVNALRTLQVRARSEETAGLILLQAAAWRGLFQAYDPQPPRISGRLLETSGHDGPPTLEALLPMIGGSQPAVVQAVSGWLSGGGRVPDLQAAWAEVIAARAGRDQHHVKYHTALMEEVDAALPRYRPTLMLGIVMRGPRGDGPLWHRYEEAMALPG